MVKEIILNNTAIRVNRYEQRKVNDVHEISVGFEVTSEEYHDIATLLYEGTFHVSVPEKDFIVQRDDWAIFDFTYKFI